MLIVVLPERDAADEVARLLTEVGVPTRVHREALAGDDDGEDAQWVVEVPGAVDGPVLEALADRYDGWVEEL